MGKPDADPTDALTLSGVRKHYGPRRALVRSLDGIDLSVPRGQLLGLIGHNGAGKSTLFKLVLGLTPPTDGQIRVHGCDVTGRGFREVRRSIGYLPENLVLWDNLNALETLRFLATLKRVPASGCEPLLDRVGLGAAQRRPVREFSKGMRQRLGFAQALLGNPSLLLLDEPTTGLDPAGIRDFYVQLERLRADGVTVIISSHVLADLQLRADSLAMLSNGRMCAHGTVAELRERARIPMTIEVCAAPDELDGLWARLSQETPDAAIRAERARSDRLIVRCPPACRTRVLAQAARCNARDLQVREPTLEDLYFHLGATP